MKKIISYVLLLSIMLTSLISFSSCKATDNKSSNITDEEREAHILSLIGDGEMLAENVTTETTVIEDGFEVVKTTHEWVVHEDYKDKEVGPQGSVMNGLRMGLDDMVLLLDNDNYSLYMTLMREEGEENMSAIAVLDKRTGNIYHSNPADTSSAFTNYGNAKEDVTDPIVSPIAVEAYDIANKRYEFNAMDHCINVNRLKIVKMDDDTIRVIYTIGNDANADLVPPVLTIDTWDWVIGRLEKVDGGAKHISNLGVCYKETQPDELELEEIERYAKDYPTIQMFPMRISRNLNNRQKTLVKEAMEAAGFTPEMLKKEMDAVEYSGPSRAVLYTIPVDLTLTEEGLSVTVDSNLILAPEKQKLYKITLYRAFGSVMVGEQGEKVTGTANKMYNITPYVIIPDGSGAIMPAKGNLTTDAFTARVYGLDDSFQLSVQESPVEQVVTPFLSFDRSSLGGMVAILSNGGSQAFATARPSNTSNNPGTSINYDFVYSERSYLTYSGGQGTSSTEIGGSSSSSTSSSGAVLSKEENIAVFTVDYFFNEGDWTHADYANFYRDYLIEKEALPATVKSDSEVPFYVDLLGAINKTESVVGIPVDHVVALTTYNQIKEIADALLEKGVENINFRYLYWANEGYYNTIYDKVDFVSALGSASELKDAAEYLQSKEISFYPDANLIYVVKDKAFDSMNFSQDAARRLDMTVAQNLGRLYSTGETWKSGFDLTVVSADKIPDMAAGFKADLEELVSNKQVSLSGIGSVIDTNYKIGRIINRTQALDHHISAIETFDGYDMIFETGSGVYFRWMGADNGILSNTDYVFQDWYSVNYKNSLETAATLYAEVSDLMNKVANKPITNHEILEAYHVGSVEKVDIGGVYATTYGNSVKFIVNYNDFDVELEDGTQVSAKGYVEVNVK